MNDRLIAPFRIFSLRFAASILFVVLMAVFTAQACGPDFYPDVFVLKLRPDHPEEFAAGKLGILLPTYPRADLTVAFRYLNGGSLTPTEQQAYQPLYADNDPYIGGTSDSEDPQTKEPPTPAEEWNAARTKFAAPEPTVNENRELKVQLPDGSTYAPDYLNCNADAFRTAVATLNSRAKTWGEKSPYLADWLKGQDAVFSNCRGPQFVSPSPAPPDAQMLLKQDRAYQIAAAEFYAARFTDARKAFEVISQDASSPWNGVARYLVARCLIREAFLSASQGDWNSEAKFDPSLMQDASTVLQSLLKSDLKGISRHTVQNQLDLVRLRTDPTARVRELSDVLIGPEPDPDYAQHLQDMTWYLNTKLDEVPVREDFARYYSVERPTADFGKSYAALAQLRSTSTLIDWLITFQSPASEAKDHAIAEWKSTHQTYWLLAAISKASEKEAAAPDLIAAAEQVKPDSPGWESFTYHRLRLLAAIGHTQEARTLLEQTMPLIKKGGRLSSINAFLGLQMNVSESLGEFLTYAPRKMISHESESQFSLNECVDVMKDPKRVYDCKNGVNPLQFSNDSVDFFNTQAPLDVLIESASTSALPQQLRTSIAEMAWVRAVLLNDNPSATELFSMLPTKLQQQAGSGIGFHPLMALLRNPGLRPYLDSGVQRSLSYDFVESYGDNWWCQGWQSGFYGGNTPPRQIPVAFLTSSQSIDGAREFKQLMDQKDAEVDLGTLTLAYANAHPDDKDVPESLYLVLRMIRYGCDRGNGLESALGRAHTNQVDEIRKSAARLLRQRYAASSWTKKAAPYVE